MATVRVRDECYRVYRKALRAGDITRPDECSLCGDSSETIHGHHPDYSRPLYVEWLCPSCHCATHVEMRHRDSLRQMRAFAERDRSRMRELGDMVASTAGRLWRDIERRGLAPEGYAARHVEMIRSEWAELEAFAREGA